MRKVISIDEARRFRPEIGDVFVGRYCLIKRLGRGGMGEVWQAADEKIGFGRMVALKLLHPRMLDVPGSRERFEREMEALIKLEHRNVVRLYDSGTEPQPFIVTERIIGITLRQRLRAQGRIPWVEAVCVAIQIAEGLRASHRKEIWHRDVKPENVMIDEEGHVTILDFGIARLAAGSTPGAITDRIGTLGYVPPEMVLRRPTDHRGDLYQLGVVLYELLTGRKPYSGVEEEGETEMQMAHVHSAPDPIAEQVPECPPRLEKIVLRLLEKDPTRRYPKARAVAAALGQVLRDHGSLPAGHALEPMVQRAMVHRKLDSRAAEQAPEAEAREAPAPAPDPRAAEEHEAPAEPTDPMPEPPRMTVELAAGFVAKSPASPAALAARPARPAREAPARSPRTRGHYPAARVPLDIATLPRAHAPPARAPFRPARPATMARRRVAEVAAAVLIAALVLAAAVLTGRALGVRMTVVPAPATRTP